MRFAPLAFALASGFACTLVGCSRDDSAPVQPAPVSPEPVKPVPDNPGPTVAKAASTRRANPSPAEVAKNERARKELAVVRAWNDAINAHDVKKLEPLYADSLELYGTRLSRAAALAAKRGAFVTHDHDELQGIDVSPTGHVQFHKKSVAKGGKALEVTGYLELHEAPGALGFQIVAEGDTTTDANLERAKESRCQSAVDALVYGTAEAKAAVAALTASLVHATDAHPGGMIVPPNGGDSQWAVAICEDDPDRMLCLDHFSVDPTTGAVTYMGLQSTDEKPVATDPALAAAVRAACH